VRCPSLHGALALGRRYEATGKENNSKDCKTHKKGTGRANEPSRKKQRGGWQSELELLLNFAMHSKVWILFADRREIETSFSVGDFIPEKSQRESIEKRLELLFV